MTNADILRIALEQSALDCNCSPDDFLRSENVITRSKADPRARSYLPLPFRCDLVSYGNNIVAQTDEALEADVRRYIDAYPVEHCFETPHLHVLDKLLHPHGLRVCYMAEYFLPDLSALRPQPCEYELRILHPQDFAQLYLPEWSNALCAQRKQLDMLCVGAYDEGRLIGLAGCSADCEQMYQIGVDVLPQYRRRGIAAALTAELAQQTLLLDKVPFYCAAWCNIRSVRNAIRCGFRPAWVEVSARDAAHVEFINHPNQPDESEDVAK